MFELHIQIQAPLRNQAVTMPRVMDFQLAPNNLITGLAGLVDDPTGDVLIWTYEREVAVATLSDPDADLSSLHLREDSAELTPALYRKRSIYAHSSILKARSSYFSSMLSNPCWSESASDDSSLRRTHSIELDGCDYNTVFWLMHWLYTDESTSRRVNISFLSF